MEIEIKGHSGCSVRIVRHNNQLYFEKITQDPQYADRLFKQAVKQQEASTRYHKYIRIPKIEKIEKDHKSCCILMEYVYSKNYVDHFEMAGFEQILYFIKAVILFIEREIAECESKKISSQVIIEKFINIKLVISNNPLICNDQEIKKLVDDSSAIFQSLPPELEIPIGICHGDLTFSNILFNGNNYYLIDFLDSFVESPLIDITKIRQDSTFLWSTLMYEGRFDPTRLKIISERIDREFDEHFQKYSWYRDYYHAFQLMNLMRVLQHAREDKVIVYLKNIIKQLLQ